MSPNSSRASILATPQLTWVSFFSFFTMRKKKCDEQWDRAGTCTRCRIGRYTCVKESMRPSRSRRKLAKPLTLNAPDDISSRPIVPQQLSDDETLVQSISDPLELPPALGSSFGYSPLSTPPLQITSNDRESFTNIFSDASLQTGLLPSHASTDHSPLPSFLFPTGFESDLSLIELLSTIDASSSRLEALPSLLRCPSNESGIQPVHQDQLLTEIHTTTPRAGSKDVSIVLESGEQTDQQLDSVDVSPSANTLPATSVHVVSPHHSQSDIYTSSSVRSRISSQDEPSTYSSEERLGASTLIEMREFADEWWTFYNSLNESYFSSVPRPARTIVKKYMFDSMLAGNNDVNRGAISAWCSSHYSLLLAKERNPVWEEWDDKAGRYYQQTILLLKDKSYGLKSRLSAILDLRLAQMDRHGAAPAYFLLLIAQKFLRESLGPARLVFDFAKTATVESLVFRAYIYSDVFRTVSLSKRRTFFRLYNSASPMSYIESDSDKLMTVNERTLSVHLGLPAELLCCFAEISNAVVDESEARHADPVRRQSKVQAIKTRIETFGSDVALARITAGPGNSAELVSDLATQEMWRHAALIYLYSSLAQLGSLALPLRQSLSQILLLSSSLSQSDARHPTSNVFRSSSRSAIWFLASTIAVSEPDRETCRQGLLEGGRGELDREQLQAVERLWREVDQKGVAPACWREFLEEKQMKVGFFI